MKSRRISVVIFYDNGKILLQDRTGHKSKCKRYGFFGGGIERKETPEQALVREIKEELDYDIKDFKFIGKFCGKNKVSKRVIFTYISRLKDIKKFKQKEGKDMKLVDLKTVEKLIPHRSWNKKTISFLKKNSQLIE